MVEFDDDCCFGPFCEVDEWSDDMAAAISFSLMIQRDPIYSIFSCTWKFAT